MLYFVNDYSEGAHPKIMEALVRTNMEQTTGYTTDEYSNKAREIICERVGAPNADVHFFVGGTQTNLTTISHMLRPYEAVIACKTGHISVHETGAIEATGHKVLEVDGKDYKVTIEDIQKQLDFHESCHMVLPRMVYISNCTEMGTLYSKEELQKLSRFCKEKNLYLFLDGARLASALAAQESELKLEDYAKYCDVFYLGGTKSGLLFGEALVVVNDEIKENFDFSIKQKGGLLAKGRLLGVQFLELLENDLYIEMGRHQNKLAKKIKEAIIKKGLELVVDTPTNQIFIYATDEQIEKLAKEVYFDSDFLSDRDEKIIRFVTSWATKEEDVDKLIEVINKL